MQNRDNAAQRETQVSSVLLRIDEAISKHEAVLNELSARLERSVARPGRKEEEELLNAKAKEMRLTVVDPVVPLASSLETLTSRLNILLAGYSSLIDRLEV